MNSTKRSINRRCSGPKSVIVTSTPDSLSSPFRKPLRRISDFTSGRLAISKLNFTPCSTAVTFIPSQMDSEINRSNSSGDSPPPYAERKPKSVSFCSIRWSNPLPLNSFTSLWGLRKIPSDYLSVSSIHCKR